MDSSREHYNALVSRLREHPDKFPPPLQRLGDALWNEADEPLSHEACLERLPEYIDAELAGDPVAQRFPDVKHHLDRCDSSAQEYAELLESEWAEQRGALPQPEIMPYPDLAFLPPPESTLESLVLKYARAILSALDPKTLPDLDVVAATFFAPRNPREAWESRAAYTFDSDSSSGSNDSTLTILAASYAATQSITAHVTRSQFDAWTQQSEIERNVEPLANAAARAVGIESTVAAAFSRAYAVHTEQDPVSLRAQLT